MLMSTRTPRRNDSKRSRERNGSGESPLALSATGLTSGLDVRETITPFGVTLCPSTPHESAGLDSAPFRRGRHRSTWKTPSLLCSLTMRPPFRRPPSWLLAPWAPRSLSLLYTRVAGASQVRPEVGAGSLALSWGRGEVRLVLLVVSRNEEGEELRGGRALIPDLHRCLRLDERPFGLP